MTKKEAKRIAYDFVISSTEAQLNSDSWAKECKDSFTTPARRLCFLDEVTKEKFVDFVMRRSRP